MFAGGELSEDAIEEAYKALTDAYWIAKENNKKYAPKTRRKKSGSMSIVGVGFLRIPLHS